MNQILWAGGDTTRSLTYDEIGQVKTVADSAFSTPVCYWGTYGHYRYDVWGKPQGGVTEAAPNPIRFKARWWDEDTGLADFRNRWIPRLDASSARTPSASSAASASTAS